MDRRTDDAPLLGESFDLAEQGYSSNMKMMTIVAAFLIVAIGVMLIQPNSLSQDIAYVEQMGTLSQASPIDAVSRSQTSLFAVEPVRKHENVSDLLREHISLNENSRNIHDQSWDVLMKFGHAARLGDPLHTMLAQSLLEGQSDAYIDALLNISVARGAFKAPIALQTTTGRLNTDALLQQLVLGLGQ